MILNSKEFQNQSDILSRLYSTNQFCCDFLPFVSFKYNRKKRFENNYPLPDFNFERISNKSDILEILQNYNVNILNKILFQTYQRVYRLCKLEILEIPNSIVNTNKIHSYE